MWGDIMSEDIITEPEIFVSEENSEENSDESNEESVDKAEDSDFLDAINRIPGPIRVQMIKFFAIGILALTIGAILSIVMRDIFSLFIAVTVGVVAILRSLYLNHIGKKKSYYEFDGVCLTAIPKMLRSMRKYEFSHVYSNEEVSLILSKKIEFKVGYRYRFYLTRAMTKEELDMNVPTSGYLGHENIGIYEPEPEINELSIAEPEGDE